MITRKKLLKGSAALAVSMVAGNAYAAGGKKVNDKAKKAMNAAAECMVTARVCLDHCINEMGQGNKTLYECAKSVEEVIAGCEALISFGAIQSSQFKTMTKMCIDICNSCEKVCRKHANHHEECKSCADSCVECVKALKAA